jgi:Family of unknown function (DUF7009)
MKLRIMGNSLRLRLCRSELLQLMSGNKIEETIRFTPEPTAKLTYTLQSAAGVATATVCYSQQRITVVIDHDELLIWNEAGQVGIYASLDVGSGERLELIIEKDFACLDGSDEQNEDAFENPQARCALVK